MRGPTNGESKAAAAIRKTMNPTYLVIVAASIVLGVWHLNLASQAILVFRSGEPLSSWIAILAGPTSTLPAAMFALLSNHGGGYWLIGGAMLSFAAFAIGERGITENLFPFLLQISIPMTLAGVCVLYLPRIRR